MAKTSSNMAKLFEKKILKIRGLRAIILRHFQVMVNNMVEKSEIEHLISDIEDANIDHLNWEEFDEKNNYRRCGA